MRPINYNTYLNPAPIILCLESYLTYNTSGLSLIKYSAIPERGYEKDVSLLTRSLAVVNASWGHRNNIPLSSILSMNIVVKSRPV
jgi:hypothetical protein